MQNNIVQIAPLSRLHIVAFVLPKIYVVIQKKQDKGCCCCHSIKNYDKMVRKKKDRKNARFSKEDAPRVLKKYQ